MNNDIEHTTNPNKGKAMAGVILLAVGGVLLLRQFADFLIPDWIFSWPMWIIACGLYFGAKHNFRKASWSIMIILGIIFLLNDNIGNADRIVWPIAIIGFGIWLILRRGRHNEWERNIKDGKWSKQDGKWSKQPANFDFGKNDPEAADYAIKDGDDVPPKDPNTPPFGYHNGDDYLDAVSIFGGVNKTILSKNFKGGEIVNIFGGAELDFTQADINGRVYIDITQVFGGTKIIVPSNWQVVSDLAAVFAGVDDKRIRSTASPNNDKILVLKGTSIFAGVDIRSY
ncbi:LiaF transmembrane domain-containing protein [Mucilaginibacter sp. 22184]|uniref:LiaF transmembrane domain-containing protein n=1 Tax=Mucilaginibacter sp. 22184 TaxID=3453887 RepID=UPI003F84E6AD